jgi:hypothetical protein
VILDYSEVDYFQKLNKSWSLRELSNVTDTPSYMQHYLATFHYMLQLTWPSSCVRTRVMRKLLCSFDRISSAGPLYVLAYPSAMDCCLWVCYCDCATGLQ